MPSLAEFIAQAERGVYERYFGPEFLLKQSYFTVDTATGIFTATMGRKIWHAVNNQARFFNAVPRTVWGNVAGWRIRTDRGSGRSRPITETGTLPTIDISDIQTVSSLPRTVGTTFGVSVKAMFTAGLEGGVGDILAAETESAQLDHIKEINEELLAGGAYLASAGAATTFTVPASIAHHYKIGDAVSQWDNSATDWIRTTGSVVSAVNTSTGVVTTATGTTYDDSDIVAVYSRAGFTSIDDVVSYDGVRYGGGSTNANYAANGGIRAYSLTYADRAAVGNWNCAARVDANAGVTRDLTLTLIDNCIRDIRQYGGEPKLILLDHGQYFRLERLLNVQQRYLGREEYVVGVGNEKTYPGTRTSLDVATYHGIPVLPDPDVPASVATDDSVLGGNVYVLDTDYLEIAVAQETQYIENRDYFAATALVVRGLLYTMGELRSYGLNRQAKIVDLTA